MKNDQSIRNASRSKVLLNGYSLDLSEAVKKVYKLELKFTTIATAQNKLKVLSRESKSEFVFFKFSLIDNMNWH